MEPGTVFAVAFMAAFGLGPATDQAQAATVGVAGGESYLTVVAPFPPYESQVGAQGLFVAPFGSATGDMFEPENETGPFPVITLPITGGTLDTDSAEARIEHGGSGLVFYSRNVGMTATVDDVVVDTGRNLVSGRVVDVGSGSTDPLESVIPLFHMVGGGNPGGEQLLITYDLLEVLWETGFAIPDFATVGFVTSDVKPVPLPPAALLLFGGLGLMGATKLRKRKAA